MFAWYPYARPLAVSLWAAFVKDAAFEDWERVFERGDEESPMDFITRDKRARFQVRGEFGRDFSLRDIDLLAMAGSKAAGRPVEWLRVDNSQPPSIVTVTFELARLRANAKGFKEVSA